MLRLEARLRVARAAAAAAAAQLEIAQAEENLLSIMESDSEMEMTPREQLTATVNPVEAGRHPGTHNPTSVATLVARIEERAATTGSTTGRQPAASSSSSSYIIVPNTNLLTQTPSVDLLGIDNAPRGNPEMFSIASPPPTPIAVVPLEQPDPSSVTDIVVAQEGLVVNGLTPSILETGTYLGHSTPVRSVNRSLDTEERRAVIVSDDRPTALQRGMLYAEVCPCEPLDPTSPSPRGAEFHTPDGQDSIINDLLGGLVTGRNTANENTNQALVEKFASAQNELEEMKNLLIAERHKHQSELLSERMHAQSLREELTRVSLSAENSRPQSVTGQNSAASKAPTYMFQYGAYHPIGDSTTIKGEIPV